MATPPSEISNQSANSVGNIRPIADLLREFSGGEDKFLNWQTQVGLLGQIYNLDGNAKRIVIGLQLRDTALKCYSKPSYLKMLLTSLLAEMKGL